MGKPGMKAIGLRAVPGEGELEGEVDFKEVYPVYVKGFLGIFKDPDFGAWKIMHGPTGYTVRSYDTRKEAIEVRDRLVNSEIDWEFTDPKVISSQKIARIMQHVEHEYEARKSLGNVAKVDRGEEMMLIDEVAEYLGIPKRMVYHYVQNGKLKSVKPGKSRRLMRSDVEEFKRQLDERDGGVREIPEGALSTAEMSEWLRYHPEHVRRLVREQGMPVHYAGVAGYLYFWKEEVLDWMRLRSSAPD